MSHVFTFIFMIADTAPAMTGLCGAVCKVYIDESKPEGLHKPAHDIKEGESSENRQRTFHTRSVVR